MALNILHPGKITETTKATQAEAVAGVDNRKYMTPLRTKQVVDVVVDDAVDQALPEAIDAAIAQASPVFDDVLAVESLPQPGVSGKLYIVGTLAYHWNGTSYDQIGFASTDELSEGTTNLYFTDQRAKDALADELSEIGSDITELGTALDSEESARISGDQSLAGGLNDVITALAGKQPTGSYATLVSGKVPADQLPSYVDDVIEAANLAALPSPGETGKIYITLDDGRAHRWSGTAYFEISPSEVTSVAGKTGAVTLAPADITGLDTELSAIGTKLLARTPFTQELVITTPLAAANGKYVATGWAADRPFYSKVGSTSGMDLFYYNSINQKWQLVYSDDIVFTNSSPAYDPSSITGAWQDNRVTPATPAAVTIQRVSVPTHTHTASDITDFAAAVTAAAPAPTTLANSGLAITGNSLVTSYNSTIADGVVSVSVGGAPAAPASAWKSKNLVQVLDDILFPTLLASVGTAKSVNLAVSGSSGTLEIGSSHSRILTADFNRGTITNGNGSTNANPLVGPATTYTFTGTGISSTAQAGNTLTFTTAVVSGSNNWAVTVAHSAGTGQYFDNKSVPGINLDASRASGTATDSTSSPAITGVHPYYYLKSASPISAAAMVTAIGNGTATKVVASSTGTLSIPYAPTAEYFAVAYPSTSTTKTRYFVTALDNGAITVVFAPVATQSVTTALWTQDYRIHVSTAALTNSNPTIELRNT